MPRVYAAIKAKADEIGTEAYACVRQGLRGVPDRFYAMENGHVVGTPFAPGPVPDEVARLMVQFGVAFVCIWPGAGGVPTGKGAA